DVRAPRARERIELERGEAPRGRLLRFRRVGLRRLGARVPAVGVDADALAARAAEQADDGHAQALAREIPERLLDAADRAPEIHRAALAGVIVVGPVGEMADVPGVAADQVARELPHVGDDRLVTVGLGVALAPAMQAVGRLHFHEQPVLAVARIEDERRDGRHLHEPISLVMAYSRSDRGPKDTGVGGLRQGAQARPRPRSAAPADRRARLAPAGGGRVRHLLPQRVGLPARAGAGGGLQVRRANARRRPAQWHAPDRRRSRLPRALPEVPAEPRGCHPPSVPARVPRQGLQEPDAIARAIRSGESGRWVSRTPVASSIALAMAAGAGTIGGSPTPRAPNGPCGAGFSTM